MTDITKLTEQLNSDSLIANFSDDKILMQEAAPVFEATERRPIYVYCNTYKNARQLTRFGELSYTSQKAHYSLLYINEAEIAETVKQIKALKFVKRVKVGHMKDLAPDFSAAFSETSEEMKQLLAD